MLTRIRRRLFPSAWGVRAFSSARAWSNRELARVAAMFDGEIINVSAWEDSDKQGRTYSQYFTSASAYWISNFGTDQGVLQGVENEIFLDLETPLPEALRRRYDVVFNHTVLEHVFEFRTAFANLCEMSGDVVILVVPWLQPLHANYGDYWRFSPQAVVKLFQENGLTVHRLTWSNAPRSAVYVFAVASRHPERWTERLGGPIRATDPGFTELPEDFAGKHAL